MRIKSVDSIAKKFSSRGQQASTDYAEGVKQPRNDWETSTAAAADNYAQGVQAAIGRGSFAKGVAEAGNEKYIRKASTVGAQRFGPGIAAAEKDFAAGVKPYLDTLSSTSLPPRFPKGDPRNNQRVTAVTEALRKKKLEG